MNLIGIEVSVVALIVGFIFGFLFGLVWPQEPECDRIHIGDLPSTIGD